MSRRAWANVWEKLAKPTVGRGKTQWPKAPSDLENHGVCFDYDGTLEEDGQVYHKYQVQPNVGKIPSSWKEWRDKHGGTHAVIGIIKIKQDVTKDDVDLALKSLEEKL
ncbi:uncharacterized protein P174DRAFT_457094 [Aspergillus novofumigatus IBT 16806]|uniref:Uncharacterized protein n=1 Tax=Aspergillus novofumigatus (strain IBT 16806) TaxID=1392255 RepID=A0A2I1CF85_ASPN1|nr:uncharacterized protein P174DRAFT_457094 [Aspergillus novofumigatus IBT 16806]PKX96285.1 hypothetical protein P174DRAFT_457094 [Aspergillus novofumigatus IBT 16806]